MFSHHDSAILYPSTAAVSKVAIHLTQARQPAIAVGLLKKYWFWRKVEFCIAWPLAQVKVNAEKNTQGPTDRHLLKLSCQPGSVTTSETPLPAPGRNSSALTQTLRLSHSPTTCFSLWTNLGWVFPARSQSQGTFLTGKWRSSQCHTSLNTLAQVSATASDVAHILQSLPLKESQCLSTITFFWR